MEARDRLLTRLRAGTVWLTDHYVRWLDGKPGAAGEALFARGLDTWDSLERDLRQRFPEYASCIMVEGRCPDDSPVRCSACAPMTLGETP